MLNPEIVLWLVLVLSMLGIAGLGVLVVWAGAYTFSLRDDLDVAAELHHNVDRWDEDTQ
jgi:hypothetical protein